jgi:hypothetical protein
MTLGVVSVANVSSVFAATKTTTWVYDNDGATIPSVLGLNYGDNTVDSYSNSLASTIPDLTFDSTGSHSIGTSSSSKASCISIAVDKGFTVTPTVDGKVKLYLLSQDNSKVRTVTIKKGDDLVKEDSTNCVGRKSASATAIDFDATSRTTYKVTGDYPIYLYGASITYDDSALNTDPTSDTYAWTVVTNPALDIDTSEVSFADTSTTEFKNTLTYKGSKYTATIPELNEDVDGVAIDAGTQIGSSEYKAYNVTVTLNASWFEEKPTYSVSGAVYDSITLEPLTGAKVNGTAVSDDGKFTVSGLSDKTDLKFEADGYVTKTITYNDVAENVIVDMVTTNKTITDGTNTATADKIYTRSGFKATTADNIDSFSGYSINGFNFVGSGTRIKLQLVDSTGNSTGSDGYLARFNLNISTTKTVNDEKVSNKDVYISYTPTEDGTLTIVGKTGSSSATDRGINVEDGSSNVVEKIEYKDSSMTTNTVDLKANTEYKIFAFTNAVNIYELTFTPTKITKVNENGVAYVKIGDDEYAVAVIGSANADSKASFNLSYEDNEKLAKNLDTVYNKVTINGKDYASEDLTIGEIAGAYLYGFKLTGDNASNIISGTTVTYKDVTTDNVTE